MLAHACLQNVGEPSRRVDQFPRRWHAAQFGRGELAEAHDCARLLGGPGYALLPKGRGESQ